MPNGNTLTASECLQNPVQSEDTRINIPPKFTFTTQVAKTTMGKWSVEAKKRTNRCTVPEVKHLLNVLT